MTEKGLYNIGGFVRTVGWEKWWLIGYESNGVENLERGESFVGFFGYNQNSVALDFALAFRSAWPFYMKLFIYLFSFIHNKILVYRFLRLDEHAREL